MLRLTLLLAGLWAVNATFRDARAVVVIHRHGHRNPIGTYPNDPFRNKSWPGGFGALTQKGSKQLYAHGTRFRLLYGSLIRNNGWYSADNINVQSSILERAIMSAQSFMAGFLPPKAVKDFNLPIWWQPVAISTIPADLDHMIAATQPCPKHDLQLQSFAANPPDAIKTFLEARPSFFADLSHNSGQKVQDIFAAFGLYNILSVQRDNNLDLPQWAQDYLVDALPIAGIIFDLLTQTDFMKKAKYGSLVTEILNRFEAIAQGNETRTIFEYSGHDTTISGFSRLLGVEGQIAHVQDYVATIVLELEQGTNNIRAYYYDNAEDLSPTRLTLPKCGYPCSLSKFRAGYSQFLIEPNTQAEYAKFCQS